MHLIIIRGYSFTLKRCYNAIISNNIYIIILVLREEAEINKLLIAFKVGFVVKNKL